MNDLISVDDALERVKQLSHPLDEVLLSLEQAEGRTLARDLASPIDLPVFSNSAMDGFALRSEDILHATSDAPVALHIIEHIPAGHRGTMFISTGTAARIMTGAPIPAGSDAVIKFEDVAWTDHAVSIPFPTEQGHNIRLAGEDIQHNEPILFSGTTLTPAVIGILAAMGFKDVPCIRQPRVVIMSTGDELVEPGTNREASQIFDANNAMLAALSRYYGAEVINIGIVPDNEATILETLDRIMVHQPDLIITSGGVSAGDFDIVKHVLQSNGRIDFWKIRMRPGKPLAVGEWQGVPVLGLPGNPLAAYTGFMLFGRAIIQGFQQLSADFPLIDAICLEPIRNGSHKRNFLRGNAFMRNGQLYISQSGHQGPNRFSSLVNGNCLIVAHEDRELYETGNIIPIILQAGFREGLQEHKR